MATITFFEKTGCVNNTKQKQILTLAGHSITPINLITYKWTLSELEIIFKDKSASECFNLNAPQITSGEIIPTNYNKEEALQLLLQEHILIKRPIIKIKDEYIVGFDKELLDKKIEIYSSKEPKISSLLDQDLETCPQKQKGTSCD